MKKNISMLSLISTISFFSFGVYASGVDISSAVKSYTYKEGKPYGLSQVYQVNAPDDGFPPYYVFLNLVKSNAYPFVFNREGLKGKDEPYSRCNVVLKVNDENLIPSRKYNSGYAEDSEPCIGVSRLQIVKGDKDIKWYVSEVLYKAGDEEPEKTDEVYFYSENNFCFSEVVSLKLAAKKISIKDLKGLALDEKDLRECAKYNVER